MHPMKWFWIVFAASFLVLAEAQAASPRESMAADPKATLEALQRATQAVVGVEAEAAEGARSAESLGRKRSGSGVVIDRDGTVLTIGYLILEAQNVELTTEDGKRVPARVAAYDLATGFGLVRPLVPLRIAPVPLGNSRELADGEPVMVATGGEDGDMGMTQLVSRRAFSGYWEYHIDTALFTSPPVGNHSGAPLFNGKGALVGVGSLFTMDALGLGQRLPGNMFVSVDLLKPILAKLQATGSTRASQRPWIGLTSSEQGGRVQVVRVNKDSPAESAGLKPGDVVLAVDDAKVATLEAFYKKLWDRAPSTSEVKLTVLQGADICTIVVKPVDRMTTLRRPAGI